jgi:hypothetical protein
MLHRHVLIVGIAVALVVGCYKNAGPVITDVRLDHGVLRYVKCDLIVGHSSFTVGNDDLEHCVDESGKDVASPTPDQPHALEMPTTTRDGGKAN